MRKGYHKQIVAKQREDAIETWQSSPAYSILHVDDNEHTLQLSKILLEEISSSLRVESESDSTNIESWIDQDFDCILVDYSMPKQDGLAVCRQIRKLKDTPIILFTSKERDEIPFEVLREMNVSYHQKRSAPENYHNLSFAILELINSDLEARTRFEDFDPDTIQPKTVEEIASGWLAFMDSVEEIYGQKDTIQPKTTEEIASAWVSYMDSVEEIYGQKY